MKKRLILLAALAFSATFSPYNADANAQSGAAPTSSKKIRKSRTLKELIDLTLKIGFDKPLSRAASRNLGFPSQLPAKTIGYGNCPDGYGRAFYVVFDDKNPTKIISLVMGAGRIDRIDSKQHYDLRAFRMSLKGSLEAAASGSGDGDKVKESTIVLNSRTKKLFKQDLDFFLKDAVGMNPDR